MRTALGIIDAQRGFMPAEEGERLGLLGFGELPIVDGHEIVRNVNRLITDLPIMDTKIFTTQDWHPEKTNHFDKWPVHCVAGTPSAALHPAIWLPHWTAHFIKGITDGDDGYSGYNGIRVSYYHQSLSEFLDEALVERVVLCGLALDYCVAATARDLSKKFKVVLITDATKAVVPENARSDIHDLFVAFNVEPMTTDEWLDSSSSS